VNVVNVVNVVLWWTRCSEHIFNSDEALNKSSGFHRAVVRSLIFWDAARVWSRVSNFKQGLFRLKVKWRFHSITGREDLLGRIEV
jgi:hypothetical protein